MPQIVFAFDKQSARSIDADGRMRVKNCILSTAEVNPYRGEEIPGYDTLGLKPKTVYELYRDPEEMEKAAATFEGIPLMIKHIPQTADAPRKEYQAGAVHSIAFDGKHLRGDLLVSDGYAIELIESEELSDLSCGYRYTPDMTAGSKNGQKYDGVMRDIQGNHVALVDDGRATGAHVADAAFRNPQLPDPSMQGENEMPDLENEHEAAPQGAAPAPAAAPAPGSPEGEQNEQVNMAAIGQALKHIAALLENIHAAVGQGAAADKEGGGEMEGNEGAMDFELTPAVEGAREGGEGAMDEETDPMPEQSEQEGLPARGTPTPHGAMDRRSVRRPQMALDAAGVRAAVDAAVKQERTRAARVEQAKRDVRGVLGEVYGMDSAGAIYREALKTAGIDTAGIPAGTEQVAWNAYTHARGLAAGVRPGVEMALDGKAVDAQRSAVLSHIAKISVKG